MQVCPTGIDIRKGLQYECIGCGACADVCDTVMDKMGYARGLVKYSTQNAIRNKWTRAETWKHVFRPRVLIYTSILARGLRGHAGQPGLAHALQGGRGARSRRDGAHRVGWHDRERLSAADHERHRIRRSSTASRSSGLPGLAVASEDAVSVESTQSRWVAVRLQLPYEAAAPGTHPIHFDIAARDTPAQVHEKSVFLVPR